MPQWQKYSTGLCCSKWQKTWDLLQYTMIDDKHRIILIVQIERWYKTVNISGKNLVIVKVERGYKTVKISGYAGNLTIIPVTVASLALSWLTWILLLYVLPLNIIQLHASSSTHASVDTNVRSVNSCRKKCSIRVHTPTNKICRKVQEMGSIVMSLLKQNALLHAWPDHTFEPGYAMSQRMILSSTIKLTQLT